MCRRRRKGAASCVCPGSMLAAEYSRFLESKGEPRGYRQLHPLDHGVHPSKQKAKTKTRTTTTTTTVMVAVLVVVVMLLLLLLVVVVLVLVVLVVVVVVVVVRIASTTTRSVGPEHHHHHHIPSLKISCISCSWAEGTARHRHEPGQDLIWLIF
jgi:UDP-N-acetylmuramyl pentapeptide phosphotransferase/UDP-N-acetylglucosamine-1-phosphate transferase